MAVCIVYLRSLVSRSSVEAFKTLASSFSVEAGQKMDLMVLCRSKGKMDLVVLCRSNQALTSLSRYEGDPGNEGWRLETEKSVLHVQHLTPGLVATDAGPGTQHVQQVISNIVHTGGRLLTVQWSGEAIPSAADSRKLLSLNFRK